ncbi:hypothetical protein, partial [Parvibaculum sp.]|uniref:hypothetical protein n=1 Tax=Parvibaculum sp. TaxID=2024848 RepID=UPI00391CA3DC
AAGWRFDRIAAAWSRLDTTVGTRPTGRFNILIRWDNGISLFGLCSPMRKLTKIKEKNHSLQSTSQADDQVISFWNNATIGDYSILRSNAVP